MSIKKITNVICDNCGSASNTSPSSGWFSVETISYGGLAIHHEVYTAEEYKHYCTRICFDQAITTWLTNAEAK